MSAKIGVLVIGAAVLVGGAALMLWRGEGTASTPSATAFLPGLNGQLAAVTRIELHRGEESVELVREGDAWTVASAGGYPARIEAVRGVVAGLSSLEIDEPLTAKRERHAELGLDWPDASNRALLVRLLDAKATALHEIVLGEERWEPKGQYVRRLAEDQTYRCRGGVTAETTARSFVDAELLTLDAAEVESVESDGLVLSRGEGGAWKADLAPGPVADGAWPEEQRTAAIQSLPSWASRLELEDVRRRDREGATWTPDSASTVRYVTSRATILVEGMRDGDALWVRLSALPKEAPPADTAKDGAAKPATDAAPPFDWGAWSARMANWEFRLPSWKSTALATIREAKPAASAGVGATSPPTSAPVPVPIPAPAPAPTG